MRTTGREEVMSCAYLVLQVCDPSRGQRQSFATFTFRTVSANLTSSTHTSWTQSTVHFNSTFYVNSAYRMCLYVSTLAINVGACQIFVMRDSLWL